MRISPWLSSLVDIILPHRCAGCERLLERCGFCSLCRTTLERWPSSQIELPGCDRPLEVAPCHHDQGELAHAIRRFKYQGAMHLQASLAALLQGGERFDWVVPVPLHVRRLRERGYNQAALLARSYARRLLLPLRCGALRRVRYAPSQTGLGRRERLQNVQQAFRCEQTLRGTVALVDDVLTTGATAWACAEQLLTAGSDRVCVVVLARRPFVGTAA